MRQRLSWVPGKPSRGTMRMITDHHKSPITRRPYAREVRCCGRLPRRMGREIEPVLSLTHPASFTASQNEVTASHSVSPHNVALTNGGPERSPPIASRRGALPKWGSPAPYAPSYPLGNPRSGDTQAFLPK